MKKLIALVVFLFVVMGSSLASAPLFTVTTDAHGAEWFYSCYTFSPFDTEWVDLFQDQYYGTQQCRSALDLGDGQRTWWVSAHSRPDSINGYIWCGANFVEEEAFVTFSLFGEEWGQQKLTLTAPWGSEKTWVLDPGETTVSLMPWKVATLQDWKQGYRFNLQAVPEPTSMVALGTGLVGLIGLIGRKRRTS